MSIRTIDLFCGAGGSSTGARKAGAQIVAGFDIWTPAVHAFKCNFPEAMVYNQDIRKLNSTDVRRAIGKVDLLLASPECTNHSNAKGAAERDEQSRSTAFQVLRFAKAFQPEWIVMENVTEMASWDKHPKLVDALEKLGYDCKSHTVNAQRLGVPQSRKRLFLLCSRSSVPEINIPNPESYTPVSTILDLSDRYRFSPLNKPGRAKATIERADRAIKALGTEKSFLLVYYGSDGSGGWQQIDKPLRTITTLDRFAYVKPSPEGYMMRMLQPEELKLAMGYDKEFKLDLPGLPRRDKIKLMGNGVCPPVMEHIVKVLTTSAK
jgi:DNA (cytosine-5)-methyltransferase 1